MELYNWILYFYVYGVLGWCTEVAYAACKHGKFVNRGFLNGPICPVYGIGVGVVVQFLMPLRHQELLLYVASTVLVTLIEGLTGFLLDKIFHHRWWDYSSLRFNLGGYVCLRFSLIWGSVCVFIVKVFHPIVLDLLAMIPFYVGLVMIVILGISLLADLYVTASAILKFNKRLQSMERIAEELRNLSDKMGENIYEGVASSAEAREAGLKRMEDGKISWRPTRKISWTRWRQLRPIFKSAWKTPRKVCRSELRAPRKVCRSELKVPRNVLKVLRKVQGISLPDTRNCRKHTQTLPACQVKLAGVL